MWCKFWVLSIYFEYYKTIRKKGFISDSPGYTNSLYGQCTFVTEIMFIKSWKIILYFTMKCDMILLCNRAQMYKQLWNCSQGINFLYVICKFLVTHFQWFCNAYWHFGCSFSVSKTISVAFSIQTLCYGFLGLDIFIYILNRPCNPEYLKETFLCHICIVQIKWRHFFRDLNLIILRFVSIFSLASVVRKVRIFCVWFFELLLSSW